MQFSFHTLFGGSSMQSFRLSGLALAFAMTVTAATPFLVAPTADAQAISMTGGSIQGTVSDPTGAVVPGATVVISNPSTGYNHTLVSDRSGFYAIGPLVPGTYTINISSPNFASLIVTTVVNVGTVTSGSEKLSIGKSAETVEVTAGEVQVNTDQIGVAGVVTRQQIDTLPINGRNILDIAQIQPGVILQSGETFDPTKVGYSALGVNGQNGRSTRVLFDGQDISDETVGTVVYNVPEGAVGEFQLNRSTQDVAGEVTSTGQVLISSQSGTNAFHGNVFGIFQDARAGFALTEGSYSPFQRDQFGGYVGGPIIKNKLFFFGGSERILQSNSSPVGQPDQIFTTIYNQYPTIPDPFHDTFSMGRLDYNGPHGIHLFARATYSVNAAFGTEGQTPYALYENQDNVPAIVGGADFTTGKFTHSIRYGYLKFDNDIQAGANALGNSVYNPSTTLGVPFEMIGSIYAGSGNEDAPQKTYQSSKQFRYDGTWTKGAHSIKYGGEVTRILQGGFAAFYSTFLDEVSDSSSFALPTCATANPIGGITAGGGCTGDPLYGYSPYEFVFGNGNGSFSERPAFGLPGGGDFSWRLAAYVGDTWKVSPYFTFVAGLRWSVDTDRANQDLATPTCGQLETSLQWSDSTGTCNATDANTPLFDFYGPGEGLGQKTKQNYANFGPQAGFVFSPGSHRLALRAGGGIYYENNLFNNGSNARAENTTAEFPGFTYGANAYVSTSLTLPGYMNNIKGVSPAGVPCTSYTTNGAANPSCFSFPQIYAMSDAAATLIMSGLDNLYKAASAVPQQNTAFIGGGGGLYANSAYGGPYKTPYSIQLNGGLQYELKKGTILSVDYVHNATLKIPLTVDTNHVGAARYLNVASAQAAIAATTAQFGCAGGTSAAAINCVIADELSGNNPSGAPNSNGIADFAGNGLDSGKTYLSGTSASAAGYTTSTGAAFAGANPNVGAGDFILPVGKSGYDALQIVLQQQKAHPIRGIVSSNAQISYNLSRAVTNSRGGSNQFFSGSGAWDQDNVNKFIGRSDSDKSNQLSLSGSATVKYGLQVGLVGHFFSAPPSNLTLASVVGGGQIFTTDLDGDGQTGDLLPGTNPGDYMHRIKGAGLAKLISNYNATSAGTLTPAGQAIVSAGLMTSAQLTQLGGVQQKLTAAPTNPIQNAATRTLDASVKYPLGYLGHYRKGLVLTPGVTMYNVTNMSNFSPFNNLADTTVTGPALAGYLNGPNTESTLNQNRILRGSGNGTFAQGVSRTTEFSLRLDF
jgi:hypothetical protein